jgi:hypothetical protein
MRVCCDTTESFFLVFTNVSAVNFKLNFDKRLLLFITLRIVMGAGIAQSV